VAAVPARFLLALLISCGVAAVLPELDGVSGWALFPPLAAVLVASFTGRLILGMSTAVVGTAIISLFPTVPLLELPFAAVHRALVEFIWQPLDSSFQPFVLFFTVSLIGMVRVVSLAGGTQGIAEALARRAEGARSTRLATFVMGLAIFFDDYANSMVVGTTMRPVADRFNISREKIAYIVDSTAAPVAGVALISTWIGYEVGLFDEAMAATGSAISGYELFLRALPARFYCLLTLLFVAASIIMQRDFGPMLRAERRAQSSAADDPGTDMEAAQIEGLSAQEGIEPHWSYAVMPVAAVIIGVIAGMHLDSWHAAAVESARSQHAFWSREYWTIVFGNAEGAKVMFLASLGGTALAFGIALTRRAVDGRRPITPLMALKSWAGGRSGAKHMLTILVILTLAWAIKEACSAVSTSSYLVSAVGSEIPPTTLPLLVFLLAAVVAFAIGTSWTTMAILIPTMVPLAHELGGPAIMVLVAAAVLDGAIFGDHCSPISDTTVLASAATSCGHLDHVRTQIPYALCTMGIAALVGYLGTALWYSAYVGLGLGSICVLGLLLLLGRNPDAAQ
jgi:Na+/H+ antiporter NhaC